MKSELYISYQFTAHVWKHSSKSAWYFVSLPKEIAIEIRNQSKSLEEAWGRMKVTACIGETSWETAIWFDTKLGTYLLPIKSAVRIREKILVESNLKIVVMI